MMPASKQPEKLKICRNCGEPFLTNNKKRVSCSVKCNTYYARRLNPEKHNAASAARMRNRSPEQKRNQKLRESYGISLNQYNDMVKIQNGKCAICRCNERLVVDHNHDSGQVRELLCHGCNSGIGFFKENVDNLLKSIEYIKRWNGK